MNPIQFVLGKGVILAEKIFAPKGIKRNPEAQQKADEITSKYVLYHFAECPFCLKVRRQIAALGLKIEMRDILRNKEYFQELMQGGGQDQAPCLRIEESSGEFRWMYESSEINSFLVAQFGMSAAD